MQAGLAERPRAHGSVIRMSVHLFNKCLLSTFPLHQALGEETDTDGLAVTEQEVKCSWAMRIAQLLSSCSAPQTVLGGGAIVRM